MIRSVVLLLALAALPAVAQIPDRASIEAAFPAIEQRVEELRRELDLPGLAWGIVVDGELALVRTAGVRDAASGAPVTPETVFRIASMTKSFTAAGILRLRDQGKLDLDDPVSKFIPELASMPLPTRDSPPITIRHLLTHSAGFPEDNPWGDRQLDVADEVMSGWLREGIPFSTAPGTSYEYSNYGFALLGRIIAAVSGTSYEDYMTREILAPLGMSSSWWEAADVPDELRATGHRREDGTFVADVPLAHGAFGPMGGLWTSPGDLARWIAFMLEAFPPRDDPESGPLARSTRREMQRAGVPPSLSAGQPFPDGALSAVTSAYAFGLGASRDCDYELMVGHSGGLPGFGSDMRWLPERGVGVFAMANRTYAPVGRITRAALSLLEPVTEPRKAEPSPALREAIARTARLVTDWDDDLARVLAADNLFLDEPLASRRAEIAALREGLGACSAAEDVDAPNALRATFRVPCERGWLDIRITLAPTRPPRVQHLSVRRATPLGDEAGSIAASLVDAIAEGGEDLPVEEESRGAIESVLEQARVTFGACEIGRVVSGDGAAEFRLRLECERGPADLSVRLTDGRIARVEFLRPQGERCWPARP